jgi:hypothetical protein
MKNVGLLVFLAVNSCSSPMPLSLIEEDFVTAYYYETTMPLTIIPWYSKTNDNLHLQVINAEGATTFRAIIRKTINCLICILDNFNQGRYSQYPGTSREVLDKNLYKFERNFFSSYI